MIERNNANEEEGKKNKEKKGCCSAMICCFYQIRNIKMEKCDSNGGREECKDDYKKKESRQ